VHLINPNKETGAAVGIDAEHPIDVRDKAQVDDNGFIASGLDRAALACNLSNFLRTLATPEQIKYWSLTSLKEKLIKIGAKVVRQGGSLRFDASD
jgi:hypothetical protein